MNPEAFKELIDQYVAGRLDQDGRAAFALLLEKPEYRAMLEAELERSFMEDDYAGVETAQRRERINRLIRDNMSGPAEAVAPVHRVHLLRRTWVRLSVAATIILLLGSAFLLTQHKEAAQQQATTTTAPAPGDIAPGHDGAILTLADGSRLVLDSARSGELAQQSGASVVLHNNRLAYEAKAHTGDAASYNMLQVPRGRQFQVVLPDGTKVWLNAASSLRYPTAFTGSERRVEMTGEAYFEVAQNPKQPFIVIKGGTETTVLGTHFNVNAYDYPDYAMENITLLQGSVRVSKGGKQVLLRPGQQAQLANGMRVVSDVDLDEVVAWKDGKFQFGETADIHSIMNQVANWYDVDVVYKGDVHNHIGGAISRSVKLSLLLKMLETTGVVDFKITGKTVEVIPK